ncbi:MAG: hypothetical protein VX403_03315, partial [Planctomycetota bacterium]|nr:hypothetical protein [Planctomycetota bacterium]
MDRALFIAGALVGASEAVIGAVMNADDGCASMLEPASVPEREPASVPEREPPPSKTRGTEGEEGSEHATGIVSETGTGTTDEEEPEQADVCHATKLASVLRQLYSLRSALGSARHEVNALRGERDAAVREADRLAEENGKLRYRIKHLVRAVREADDRVGEPAAGEPAAGAGASYGSGVVPCAKQEATGEVADVGVDNSPEDSVTNCKTEAHVAPGVECPGSPCGPFETGDSSSGSSGSDGEGEAAAAPGDVDDEEVDSPGMAMAMVMHAGTEQQRELERVLHVIDSGEKTPSRVLGMVSLMCEDEGESRTAARRLMLLLHPDKCKLRRTREAYDAVVDAKLMAEKIESGPDWQRMCREAEAHMERVNRESD